MTTNERLALIQDLQRKYPPGSLEEIRRLLRDPQRSAAVEKSAAKLRPRLIGGRSEKPHVGILTRSATSF
jgi:hypothetical protein